NAEILVEPQHLNRLKILHGGMAATLVDIGGSLAIAAKGMNSTGLSTDINITYLDASRADDIIQMNSECVKFGRTLAFTVTELINKNNGKLIAHGRHTKFIAIAHKDPLNQFKFPEKKD
ncbi:1073_t:CDS:2, partial [Diversispora eburnea]